MKIKKYEKARGNKYNVLIDDEVIKLYDDVIIHFELLRKNEIDEDLFNEIIEYNDKLEAYYKALKYISRRLRTEKEVRIYLGKNYSRSVIEDTVNRLKQDGYLDEKVYLKCYFTDMINLKNIGPNKIKKDLLKLGYSEEIINDKLNSIEEKVWLDKIETIVKKKIATNKNYGNNKLKEKLLYELSNLGYYKWMIENVLKSSEFNSNKDIIEKEYLKIFKKLSSKYEGYDLETKILYKMVNKGFLYEEVKDVIEKNKKDY